MDLELLRNVLIFTAIVLGVIFAVVYPAQKQDIKVLNEYLLEESGNTLILIVEGGTVEEQIEYITAEYPDYYIAEQLKDDGRMLYRLIRRNK